MSNVQYTCPACGVVGAGTEGSKYSCHRCPCLEMLRSNNGWPLNWPEWVREFVKALPDRRWAAFDETQVSEIGRYFTLQEAVSAVIGYANNKEQKERGMEKFYKVGTKVYHLPRILKDFIKGDHMPWEVREIKVNEEGVSYSVRRGDDYMEFVPSKYIVCVDETEERIAELLSDTPATNMGIEAP